MTAAIPIEADWDASPGLLEGAQELVLTPERCGLEYWIHAAAQGTWAGLRHGHRPATEVPALMREPGPLRDAIMHEYGFRSIAEEIATRAIGYLVIHAPSIPAMEFYATQLIDEARHSDIFRHHFVELGVPAGEVAAVIERTSGADRDRVLVPLRDFAMDTLAVKGDFIGGVVMLTILVEGVLAPAAELSERKWRVFDPPAAEIGRGANIDEVRHLGVGGTIVRDHLQAHPGDKTRLLDLITEGRALWHRLPVAEMVYAREVLFQQGMEAHAGLLGDYELVPGRRLIDTGAEERLVIGQEWSASMQDARLRYMGLEEAIPG